MLSVDLENAANAVKNEAAQVNEGKRISVGFMRGLTSNLRALAEQARQLECQVAPGSPIIDNTMPLRPTQQQAARA